MNDDIPSPLDSHSPEVFHLILQPGQPGGPNYVAHTASSAHYLSELTGRANLVNTVRLMHMASRISECTPTCAIYIGSTRASDVVTVIRASWMVVSDDEAIVRFVMRTRRRVTKFTSHHNVRIEVYGGFAGYSVFYPDGWSFSQMTEVEEVE